MWIVVLLVVFAPVGIFLMWKYTDWQRPLKIGVAIVAGVVFLAAFANALSDGKDDSGKDKVTPASTSTPVPSGAATTPAPAATTAAPTSAPPVSSTAPPPATTAPAEPPPAAPAQDEANVPKADPPKADPPKADPPKVDPPKVDPPPANVNTVHPGSFCSPVGATGVTDKGTAMVCSLKAGDSRARWRAA
ncbi:hypothetical protein OG948_28250 [Embleya sp. NBC_00888]|uniref:hypothetical protein n=1 Tax=Embleya sp. NBC_00888 TaxID=2975960 RepID=UPI0038678BE7|nr:hypothetical protein OG948_28250 [Embleya sp. NBC_00888]